MRLGFGQVPTEEYSKHVELIAWAERVGFDSAWVADQTLFRDPYTLLLLAAGVTESMQLGLAVTNPYTRHPTMTARHAAAVAEVSGGRAVLGLGAGNRRELIDPLRLDGGATAARIRETVEIVQQLMTGETLDYRGEHYQVEGIGLDFEPTHPLPVYVAGRGRRVLEVAGAVADGAIVGGLCSAGGIGYAREAIARGAASTGRTVDDLALVSWVTCVVTADAAEARAKAAPMVAHVMGGAPPDLFDHLEIPRATVEAVRSAYAASGKEVAAAEVTDACLDSFTIIGDADHCVEAVRRLENAGVGELAVLLSQAPADNYRDILTAAVEGLSELARG